MMAMDATQTNPRKLTAFLSYRVATRRYCLIRPKNNSTTLLVQVPVVPDRLRPVLTRRDTRLGTPPTNRYPVGIRIVTLVGQHRRGLGPRNQRRQVRAVSGIGPGQLDRHRVPQRVHGALDLPAAPTALTAQRLGRLTAGAAATDACARTVDAQPLGVVVAQCGRDPRPGRPRPVGRRRSPR